MGEECSTNGSDENEYNILGGNPEANNGPLGRVIVDWGII
jgi:hypothetical protein